MDAGPNQKKVIDGIEMTGFPWKPYRTGLKVEASIFLESGCSFEEGEWLPDLHSFVGNFNMYSDPELIREAISEFRGVEFEENVFYFITLEMWVEDDGFPAMLHRFEVLKIETFESEWDDGTLIFEAKAEAQ